MKLSERYNLDTIRNRTAEMVYGAVEKLVEEGAGLCLCESCVLDLAAFALNRVTPRYSTSLLDPLHPDENLEMKMRIEIELAIEAGLKKLREHPHHV